LEMRQEEMATRLATMANVPGVSDDELWGLYAPITVLSKRSLRPLLPSGQITESAVKQRFAH